MIILALETATTRPSVAILNGQHLVGYMECETSRSLTSQLIPLIDRLLTSVSLQPSDLEGLAVCIGPGTFTGLRAGLATMTAFRLALDIPLVGVSTLEGMVWNQPCSDRPLLSTVKIRSGKMYWALFRWVDHRVVCVKEAQIGEVTEIFGMVTVPTLVLGEGWRGAMQDQELTTYPFIETAPSDEGPSAKGIGLAGQLLLASGIYLPPGCTPQYIQPSYAELLRTQSP